MWTGIRGSCFAVAILAIAALALAQVQAVEQRSPSQIPAVPLSPDELYRGWLASEVLGKQVTSKPGADLGRVRNVLIGNETADIAALVVEAATTSDTKEYVFRVPWQKVEAAALPDRVVVEIADSRLPEYGIFVPDGPKASREQPEDFAVSDVIGDRARLQTGMGYGYVRDVVFTPEGRLRAVLITRGMRLGGGTVAFGFPQSPSERWRAGAAYYGLPYVTIDQANVAAVAVEMGRFAGPPKGSKG
jgi:sporulation protein YlmC with PRC-barrel domain